MDNRLLMKQFIDMDELSKQWESINKLVTPINNTKVNNEHSDIIEYIKSVKYSHTNNEEYNRGRVLKK